MGKKKGEKEVNWTAELAAVNRRRAEQKERFKAAARSRADDWI